MDGWSSLLTGAGGSSVAVTLATAVAAAAAVAAAKASEAVAVLKSLANFGDMADDANVRTG